MVSLSTSPWETRARDKESRILSSVPQEFIDPSLSFSATDTGSVLDVPTKILSPEELAITALKAEEIPVAISKGTYSAVQVLKAFTHRAVLAHQLLHCCLDFMYPAALARATALDEKFAQTGQLQGALHGIPVSLKDQCRVKGTETTCGFVSNLGTVDEEDSLLVQILQDAGAVPFCKTSLSVGCMWGETINNIIGRTSNPYNRSFSCGGSSGGEGALIGFRGSPMGVGSDLGGSIRSPSAYQGLYGLRPSSGRIPYFRILNSMEGQETIPSVVGPMAQSAESLRLFAKTVVDSKPWTVDPKCQPLSWRDTEDVRNRPLRIAIMHWDGIVLPQPPIRRALREVEKRIIDEGHEIVPMFDIDQKAALDLALKAFSADANGDIDRTIAQSGEPPVNLLSRPADNKSPPITLLESWSLAMKKMEYQARVLKLWNETARDTKSGDPIDVYIAPVNPSVCPMHGDYDRVRYIAYTGTLNVLDFTACTLPVTFVEDKVDLKDQSDSSDGHGGTLPEPACDLDRKIRSRYDPAKYQGLPVTLQVVGRRLEEEKVLAIVQILDNILKGSA